MMGQDNHEASRQNPGMDLPSMAAGSVDESAPYENVVEGDASRTLHVRAPAPDPVSENVVEGDAPETANAQAMTLYWRARWRARLDALERSGSVSAATWLRQYGRWSRVAGDTVFLVIVVLCLNVVLAVAAYAAIGLHDHDLLSSTSNARQVSTSLTNWLASPVGLAMGGLSTQAAILLTLQLRVIRRGVISWSDLGVGAALRDRPGRAFLIGLGLGLCAFVAGEVLLYLLNALHLDVQGQQRSFQTVQHAKLLEVIPFALTVVVTAPLAEETFFRGYALRALAIRHGFRPALTLSSLLFAGLHLLGGVGWEAVALFFVGAILGWGFTRTGNLITDVTAHALNNAIGLMLLYGG
jgi:membrane protease YdiL (CAAX protease family)